MNLSFLTAAVAGVACSFLFAATMATSAHAVPNTGACCSINGCCSIASIDVEPHGGVPNCFESTEVNCGLGNTYQGNGTTCAGVCSTTTTTLEVVPSACCASDGSCTDVDPAACDGVAQGPGTECATVECTQPTTTTTLPPVGACCLFGGGCNDLTPKECDGLGDHSGDETDCGSVKCAPTTTVTVTSTTTSPPTTTSTIPATTTTLFDDTVCGDANSDGNISAPDALIALKTAVGSGNCIVERCDYNGDGNVTASDALAILKKAVGQPIPPMCPL